MPQICIPSLVTCFLKSRTKLCSFLSHIICKIFIDEDLGAFKFFFPLLKIPSLSLRRSNLIKTGLGLFACSSNFPLWYAYSTAIDLGSRSSSLTSSCLTLASVTRDDSLLSSGTQWWCYSPLTGSPDTLFFQTVRRKKLGRMQTHWRCSWHWLHGQRVSY